MSKGSLGYGPASNAGTSRSKRYRHRTFIMLGVTDFRFFIARPRALVALLVNLFG
jgi:hypothetical protein